MQTDRERLELAPGRPQALAAQLDLEGNAHELAPKHERMRLFEPAPAQLDGQTWAPELLEPGEGA